MHDNPEVLVIGAGPTGLAAALFLVNRGIKVRIVDKKVEPSPFSKAFGINARTLSLLKHTGVTDRFLTNGRKMHAINFWRKGRIIFRNDLSNFPHPYSFLLIQSQAESEAIMAEVLAERGVRVERGMELKGIKKDKKDVTACVEEASGRQKELTTSLVLGADGAYSVVREATGIGFKGGPYPGSWQLFDVLLDFSLDRNEAHSFIEDEGAMFMVRLKENLWRVIGNVPDMLHRLPNGTQIEEKVWESSFGFSHKIADRFMKGNVFLAGDAAHIHSALGARGMNLGIEDAFVFADLVSKGNLVEYDRMRRPVVSSVMWRLNQMTETMRGHSFQAKALRFFSPLLPWLFPLVAKPLQGFLLGLDHPVKGVDS